MTTPAVQFESIRVDRALGITRGQGWVLDDLSAGVNIIHGPNGCGKSTTARVIQTLLWPGRFDLNRPTVSGRWKHDGQSVEIQIEAGDPACYQDGKRAALPSLGPGERARYYWLALDDLIQRDDEEFAKAIADASLGGFDLDAAAAALGYRSSPAAPGLKERQQLIKADQQVTQARQLQQQLHHQAAQLSHLQHEQKKAGQADQQTRRLEQALALQQARLAGQQLEQQLAQLPAGVAKLRGHERQQLDQFASDRAQAMKLHEQAAQRLADAKARRREVLGAHAGADADAPDWALIPADVLLRLRSSVTQLKQLEADLARQQLAHDQAAAQAHQTRRRLQAALARDPADGDPLGTLPAALDQIELPEVSSLASRMALHQAAGQSLDQQIQQLAQQVQQAADLPEPTRLQAGLAALGHWLSVPAPAGLPEQAPAANGRTASRWAILFGAIVIVLLVVLLAVTHHAVWLAGLLLAGPSGWAWWISTRQPTPQPAAEQVDERAIHARTFERTSLSQPADWEPDAVGEHLALLSEQLARCLLAREAQRRLDDLKSRKTQLEQQGRQLIQQRDQLAQKLGLHLSLQDDWLPVLVSNLQSWQKHHDAACGLQASIDRLTAQRDQLLQTINQTLVPLGHPACDHGESAAQTLRSLEDRQQHLQRIAEQMAAAKRECAQAQQAISRLDQQRQRLLAELDLTDDNEYLIDDWLAQRPLEQSLREQLLREQTRVDQLEQQLASDVSLAERDHDTLTSELSHQRELARQYEPLTQQISQITARIEQAEQGSDLTEALACQQQALADLARTRQQNRSSLVGYRLVQWLKQETVRQTRPAVFEQAGELLVRMTHGMLQLEVDDHDDRPSFFARMADGNVRPIHELSLGERVQVLMAVRLAFMQQDESAALPLILDEVLGTTDDQRAGAVIAAVAACAQQGRQIFCFTAQHDEAGKWIAQLRAMDVPYRVIDLAAARGQHAASTRPLELAQVQASQPPRPLDQDWQQYGQTLGVPAVDPWQPVQAVHLWHVVHDPAVLYDLLCHHVKNWGQLEILLRHGGEDLLPPAAGGQLHAAQAAARAIEAVLQAWRIGRGQPIDRAVLQDADGVTERFIDEVSQLAAQLQGDARALVTALRNKAVSGWQQRNTDRLADYLAQHGYLSEQQPLDRQQVTLQAMAAVAEDLRCGRVETAWLKGLVQTIMG